MFDIGFSELLVVAVVAFATTIIACIGLLAVKDAPSQDPHWLDSCRAAGFQSMPSLPTGVFSNARIDLELARLFA